MSSELDEYKMQLQQVDQALQLVTDPSELESLRSLRRDLLELLELTKQTVAAVFDGGDNVVDSQHKSGDRFDDEMKLFMNEINQLDTKKSSSTVVDESDIDVNDIKEKLGSMVGQKCSAPHYHAWGAVTHHNAIICGIEPLDDCKNIDDMRMRILFTNPTHKEMIPCSYFLEGECRFDAEKCHFSHGELVPFGELKEYKEPEFEKLARNCVVLAKMKDRMWHKGRVLCANFVEKNCRVRLDSQHKEMDFPFEDLLPIFHDEDLSSGSSSDSSDFESDDGNDLDAVRKARLVEQSLFSFAPNQALGEWEKHTRGIGSKLMAKMGYINGTGLGWDGKGIITPITAQVLPQGRSLDHCMLLREAANGDKDLFSVEKKLKRNQKKQETLNTKSYDRECKKIDVFSFLNATISTNPNPDKNTKAIKSAPSESSLRSHTTKTLNVESVRIADEIRKIEKGIHKMRESMRRHTSDSDVHKRLQAQLSVKSRELSSLKKTESSLAKEQASRRTKDKLCVF